MNRRILPTLVAAIVCAFPAAAAAQTSTYDATPPTSTMPSTNPTPPTKSTTSTKVKTPKSGVEGTNAEATTPAPAVAPASTPSTPSTGTTPTKLAYTGSDVWLVALLGAFALLGGVGLVRSSRTPS